MSIKAFNERIACEPFPKKSQEQKVVGHLVQVVQTVTLARLKVVFGNDKISAGSHVYVDANAYFKPWGKQQFTVENQDVILVPQSEVALVETA